MWFVRRRRKRSPRSRAERAQYQLHKEPARTLAHELVSVWAPRIGVSPRRIAIRDQRSRWGSCSTKGNLNFNYRIALIPHELVEYIVVHELCHLHEFNHSERFWSHVEMYISDYHLRKQALTVLSKSLGAHAGIPADTCRESTSLHSQNTVNVSPVAKAALNL